MTAITRMLNRREALYDRAMGQTDDSNEGNMVVHNVMTHAFAKAHDLEGDVDLNLAAALQRQARSNAAARRVTDGVA